MGSWGEVRGLHACELTPRRPGHYAVQYRVHVSDLFGRKARVATHTGGFEAR